MANTDRIRVFVRLLNEGTEVSRPVEARRLGDGLFEILPIEHYDPEDETWEFPPGSVVRLKRIEDAEGAYFLAVSQFL